MNVIELNRRELELQVTEAALHVEAERLASWANELKQRQSKLPQGLRPASVPTDAIEELEARAEKARAAALETREAVNTKLRSLLENTASTLKKLEEGLKARDEVTSKPTTPPGLRAVSNSPKDLGLAAHVLSSMPTRDASLADSLAAIEQDEPLSSTPAASVLVLATPPVAAKEAAPVVEKAKAAAPVVRVSPRVKMSAQVDFSSESNFYQGFSANISEGGLFVTTLKLLPLGTEVDLAFSLPSGERINTRGVVRWTRETNDAVPDMLDGMGLQFLGLEPHEREAIERFVEQRDPLFFAA